MCKHIPLFAHVCTQSIEQAKHRPLWLVMTISPFGATTAFKTQQMMHQSPTMFKKQQV